MKNLNNKGFTLVELIIVMVLLGILAAVAVPRMSQSIMAGEEAAEQKFLSSLVSALEIQAADEFVRNSKKQYSDNPFNALDKTPQRDNNSGEGWWIENVSAWDECCGAPVPPQQSRSLDGRSGFGAGAKPSDQSRNTPQVMGTVSAQILFRDVRCHFLALR